MMATAVPMKGSTGKFAVDKCLEFIEENGDHERDIIVKTDQENAINLVVKELIEERGEGKTIPEESPKKSSGSNGIAERAVQELEGQIRVLFLGLQGRLGRELDAREGIVAFIPEYAAYLYNRLHRGDDGKVPYERMKGKKVSVLGVELGNFGSNNFFTPSSTLGSLSLSPATPFNSSGTTSSRSSSSLSTSTGLTDIAPSPLSGPAFKKPRSQTPLAFHGELSSLHLRS